MGTASGPGQRRAARITRAARLPILLAVTIATGAACVACGSARPPAAGTSPHQPSASTGPAVTAPASPGRPAGKLDSCTVITRAEASAALGGQPVRPPIRGHAYVEGGVACVFYGPDVPPGASPDIPYGDTVRVVLVTGPTAKAFFDDYRSRVHAQPLPGLGDAAFYDGFASVSVLKGDAYVRIAVGIPDPLPAEKALAADALARM